MSCYGIFYYLQTLKTTRLTVTVSITCKVSICVLFFKANNSNRRRYEIVYDALLLNRHKDAQLLCNATVLLSPSTIVLET